MHKPSGNTILHIVNQSGGGTMRYIESLIHSSTSQYRHFVWYVGENQHILYDVTTPYYYAFSAQLNTDIQRKIIMTLFHNVGVSQFGVHLHSLFGAALSVMEAWADLAMPITATFHDHHFLSENPFSAGSITADNTHIERVQRVLKDAQIIVPSNYLWQQAAPYFVNKQLHTIPHGTEPPLRQLSVETKAFVNRLKQRANWQDDSFTVATVGAISHDKGLDFMSQWLSVRGSTQFVCLGYTADAPADKNRPQALPKQVTHGFYHHTEVPALIRAYSVDVVVFFSGIPESFCYALSDMSACVPVLAPDVGALGERVANEKLGQVYPITTTPEQLNAQLESVEESSFLPNPLHQSIETMTLKTESYYRQHQPQELLAMTLDADELSQLLADQLHSDNLKWELTHLVRQHDSLTQNVNDLKKQREEDIIELRKQQAHLEEQAGYFEILKLDLRKQQAHLEEQALYIETLRTDIVAARDEIHAMQQSLSWKITKPLRAIRRLFA